MVIIEKEREVFRQRFDKDKSIGEWRKGVAIGYEYNNVPYLISEDKKILYRGGIIENHYVDEILRTSEGYYLVYEYKDCSAPGKDSEYRKKLSFIISEDGENRIPLSKLKNIREKSSYIEDNGKKVFVPREMGLGIVEHENTFYRLEDFEKLFDIPKKFVIKSIFENGFCRLSIPEDNRDFIVTVKNKKVEDWVDVNDVDKLTQLIEKTNDTSLVKYCKREDSAFINIIKKQQEEIKEKERLTKREHLAKVIFYSDYPYYDRCNYISEEIVTPSDFEQGITLSQEELKIIQELHQIICQEGENEGRKYRCRIRKIENTPYESLECMFYKDFMLLRLGGDKYDRNKMYRFYSLDGKCLSDKIYRELYSTKNYIKVEDDMNFNNHYFHYTNSQKDSGIIVIKDGNLHDNPFPKFLMDEKKLTSYGVSYFDFSIHEHFIKQKDNLYDFFYNKIQMNYIDVKVEEVIKNYLFRMQPKIECHAGGDLLENGKLFCLIYHAEETYRDGKLYLPTPGKLSDIQNELHFRSKNVPNFVKGISFIGDYVEDSGEPYTLYLFECKPHAYCDTRGQIFYDFDPNNIIF